MFTFLNKFKQIKRIKFILFVLVVLISFSFANNVFGWTAPTAIPPNENRPTPLNVSDTAQTKSGALTINGKFYANNPAGSAGDINTGTAGLYVYSSASRYIRFNTAGSYNDLLSAEAPLTINHSGGQNIYMNIGGGNVGIGTATPDADYRLTTTGGGVKMERSTTGWTSYIANTYTGAGANSGLLIDAGQDSGDSILLLRNQAGTNRFQVTADGTVKINDSPITTGYWNKDTYLYYNDGNVGIGTDSPSAKLQIYTSDDDATQYGLKINSTDNFQPSINYGVYSNANMTSYVNSNIYGGYFIGEMGRGSNSSGSQIGLVGEVKITDNIGSLAVNTETVGVKGITTIDSAGGDTIGEANSFKAAGSVASGDIITNYKGYRVTDVTGAGTITNNYGLYIDSLASGSSSNYAIYTAGTTESYFGGNVGIGTTSPSQPLHIGNSSVPGSRGVIQVATEIPGGGSNRNWIFGTAHDSDAPYDFFIKDVGMANSAFVIEYSTGEVGIGTVTPAYALDVVGDINLTGTLRVNGSPLTSGYWTATSTSDIYYDAGNVGIGLNGPDADYKLTLYNGGIKSDSTDQPAGYFSSSSGYGLLVNSGNVGIGTTSPGYKLDVEGVIASDPAGSGTIRIGSGTSGDALLTGSNSTGHLTINASNSVGGDIIFQTRSSEKMRIDASSGGNVGIGTASPATLLEIEDTGEARLRIDGNTAAGSPAIAAALELRSNVDGRGRGVFMIRSDSVAEWFAGVPYQGGGYSIGYDASGGQSEYAASSKLFINTSGNVGIGTTNPGYKLDVAGDINLTGTLRVNGSPLTSGYWTQSGTDLYYNTGDVGIGTTNPGTKLDVAGNVYLGNSGTGDLLTIKTSNTPSTSGGVLIQSASAGSSYIYYDRQASWAGKTYFGNNASTTTDAPTTAITIDGTSGSNLVGIGTTSPDANYKLSLSGGGIKSESTSNPAGYFSSSSGYGLLVNSGNVGIGTITPSVKLDVAGNVNLDNYSVSTAGSLNRGYYVYKSGTTAYGMKLQYAGGEYGPMIFGPNQANRFISFGKVGAALEDDDMVEYMRIDLDNGNVGIATTTPAYTLDVAGDVRFTGKLTVPTIDPQYNINGNTYGYYISDYAGGVRMNVTGKAELEKSIHIIDFDDLEEGSELWLFAQKTDLGEKMENLIVLLTPEGEKASLWYEIIHSKNQLVVHGDKDVKFSYRLSAPRYDWQDHPVLIGPAD